MHMIRVVNSRIQVTADYTMKQNKETILCLYTAHVLVQTRTNINLNLVKFDSSCVLTLATFGTCNNYVLQENRSKILVYVSLRKLNSMHSDALNSEHL